jgi:hypothetical protein
MLIEQLPMIVKEAAAGLAAANVSVLNGADGLSEIAAGLVGQGLTILESVKRSLAVPAGPEVTLYDDSPPAGQHALPDTGNGQPR